MRQYIIANNRIRAKEVRLIDQEGQQLGIFTLPEALRQARQAGLDLILITEKASPPICKITDYGKYAYSQSKKERKQKIKQTDEIKGIRLSFNISTHDLETRVKAAEKFLKKGNKVRLEMRLRGRGKSPGLICQRENKPFFRKIIS